MSPAGRATGATRAPLRRTRLRKASSIVALLLLLACIASVALPVVSATAAPARRSGVRFLGQLPEPKADGRTNSYIIQVDPVNRRLYYLWRRGTDFYLDEYDIGPMVPRLLRETYIGTYNELKIDSASPYTMQIDTDNRRLFMLGQTQYGSAIRVVDLKTFKVAGTWDLGTALPGYVAQGMTYSAEDGRIYLVGSQSGNVYGTQSVLVTKPAQVSMIAAIDAGAGLDAAPQLAWARPVPQCQLVMDTSTVGALIARSKNQDALYFACIRPDPWPGESGVVRLWIDPKATQPEATEFKVDLFPISGSFTDLTSGIVGMAAFDYTTDRFFMQSLASATPGAWVLDGQLSAWVGFIAAPDNKDRYLGLDQSSGHYYIGSADFSGEGGYLLVSDARSTPIPQGEIFKGLGATSFIATDPVTHRLFVQVATKKLGLEGEYERSFIVLKDDTALARPPKPLDYDSLTSDIPEGPKTITNYAGGVNGFGARAVLVGGYGGVLSASGRPVSIDRMRPGDRGLTAARVPALDLRNGGAGATAQALVSDTNTEAELNDAGAGEWPWLPTSCLDGNGEPVENSQSAPGGTASVKCDLAKYRVEASVDAGPVSAEGVRIGSSSFRAATWRDAKKGVITETLAIAKGIELTSPDGSGVSIAEVTSTATTSAHGRPGTATAAWQRNLSGIRVTNADGEVVQEAAGCSSSAKEDTCGPLVDQMNEALQQRMHVELPEAVVVATKKGAFGGVQQADTDYYQGGTVNNQGSTFAAEAASRAVPGLQVTVFNDTVEKSRLVVQLAAIQANSIYTNSLQQDQPVSEPVDDLPDVTDPVATDLDTTGPVSGGPSGGGTAPVADGGAPQAPVALAPVAAPIPDGVMAFLTRGPAEALLFGALWSLFGAAGVSLYRRQALLRLLQGPPS